MVTVDRFNYYFIECNGLWAERLQEVKDKGFENASPIARLIYECERDNINQHASEDLKHISATLAMLDEIPFTETSAINPDADNARFHGHQEGTAV